jgi:hypothetical protein
MVSGPQLRLACTTCTLCTAFSLYVSVSVIAPQLRPAAACFLVEVADGLVP